MDWTLSLQLQKNLDELDVLFANYKRANPKSYNILMLHQTCNAVMAGTGEDRNSILDGLDFRACELKDHMLPHGFDICVVGDTHYHTEFMLLTNKSRNETKWNDGLTKRIASLLKIARFSGKEHGNETCPLSRGTRPPAQGQNGFLRSFR